MKRQRIAGTLAATVVAWLAGAAFGPTGATGRDFDYLVLTLSWSPTYCTAPEGRSDREQCAPGRRFAFVVHGLWPQFRRGWPEHCPTAERFVPRRTIDAMLDIMPSKRLVIHEWRKHGTCYGNQDAYFGAIRTLFDRIEVPARYRSPRQTLLVTPQQLEADFIASNPWLDGDMIAAHCGSVRDRTNLRELRICFDTAFRPRACGDNERRSCQARILALPPVR